MAAREVEVEAEGPKVVEGLLGGSVGAGERKRPRRDGRLLLELLEPLEDGAYMMIVDQLVALFNCFYNISDKCSSQRLLFS